MSSQLPIPEPYSGTEPERDGTYRVRDLRRPVLDASASARRLPGVLCDAAALSGALGLAAWLAGLASPVEVASAACICAAAVAVAGLRGSYAPPALGDPLGPAAALEAALTDVSLGAMSAITALAVMGAGTGATAAATAAWPAAALLVAAARLAARITRPVAKRPVLIVGAGRVGARLERHIREQPELGLEPVGFLDSDPLPREDLPSRVAPVLGPVGRLPHALRRTGAKHVVVAFSSGPERALLGVIDACHGLGVEVCVVPRLFDAANARLKVSYVGGTPVLRITGGAAPAALRVKDVVDRVAAVAMIVLLAPLLLAIAAAVRLSSPGPVLFRQQRMGLGAETFEMLKFRSMEPAGPLDAVEDEWDEEDGPGGVEGADRRTRVGTFLRATSLDELPQLFNIARGEMSFVGPRPERPQFVQLFADSVERYSDRHRMKPGLTGWSQVNGLRGQTSLVRRVERDNWYIENWSSRLDLRILLRTFGALRRGAV